MTGRPRRGAIAALVVLGLAGTLVAALPATADAKGCRPAQFDRGGTCTSFRASAAKIAAMTRSAMVAEGARAVIVRVEIGRRTLISRGFGTSTEGVPATPDMRFRPGSMAIPMLTTALLQLQDDHRLDLDDTLSRWFPELPNADRVTLRMLASSTSGYPDYLQGNPPFQAALFADVFRHWSDDELLLAAFGQPLPCAPGACFHYAHTNFVILGRVLEKVTGRSVTALVRSRFIGPLGLDQTQISKRPQIPAPALHAYTTERGVYEDSTGWSPSWALGQGMVMTSTARDMVRQIRAIGSGRLFSKSAGREFTAPLSRGLPGALTSIDYGLGVDLAGGWVFQNPQFNGHIGLLAYLPARRIAIVVENTNGPRVAEGRAISGVIAKQISQYLAPDRPLFR